MQLNYYGAIKMIMELLPGMRERKSGHIINISSIGVQTNTPRFSAYVASKAALDAFSRCVAPECRRPTTCKFTTIYMPLVRTPMIAPTDMYKAFPTLSPEEAARDARRRDDRQAQAQGVASSGTFGEVLYAIVARGGGHRAQPGLPACSRTRPPPRARTEEGAGDGKGEGDRHPRRRPPGTRRCRRRPWRWRIC